MKARKYICNKCKREVRDEKQLTMIKMTIFNNNDTTSFYADVCEECLNDAMSIFLNRH